MTEILALDVATRTGWARGDVGDERPFSGSVSFAGRMGASHNAILANCFDWINREHLATTLPDVIVLEALLPFGAKTGRTTKATNDLLIGLQAVIRLAAFKRQVYRVETASVGDVRHHFIGGNFRRAAAKG